MTVQLRVLLPAYCVASLFAAIVASPPAALAVTPESPEVQAMIQKGLSYLEGHGDGRLGGQCLTGLCFFKNGGGLEHPRVQAALKACETSIAAGEGTDNYSLGLALVFLCETDPQKNRALAQKYLEVILKKQRSDGAWSYPSYITGDTSQTQYPTLGMWTAARSGIEVPLSAIEKATGWLLRTQDVSGGWAYQGNDPNSYTRMQQGDIKPSTSAAGLGSLYVCADLLEIPHAEQQREERKQPAALREIGEDAEKAKRRSGRSKLIDPQFVRKALADGNAWFNKNFTVDPPSWKYYYLYGLERYQSYRELHERKRDPEPEWYNKGVEFLAKIQQADGSWVGDETPGISTAFCVLFLCRSSQKSIKQVGGSLGDAVLLGGMGLPPNTADLRERDGKIVETPFAGSVDELLAVLNDPDNPELAQLAQTTEALALAGDVTKRSGQIARLRSLVSAGAFEARLIAVRTLGRVRELDNAPVLIYAMTDPDLQIVREADKGLRFISRKFGGVGLPAEPQPDDVRSAIKAWKAWYKSVRPDGEFLD